MDRMNAYIFYSNLVYAVFEFIKATAANIKWSSRFLSNGSEQ